MLGVTPLFGMESNVVGGTHSRLGVLPYNFVKEFMEEMYGLEEVVRADDSRSISPDWFLEPLQARSLLSEFEGGHAYLELLGTCVDCTDGTFTYALLAHFRRQAFLK